MIQLFYCSNSMTESEARKLATRFGEDDLKMLGLPCSGKITIPYLVKAFESGADGVVLCGCRPEDCRNLEGVLRAFKRGQAVEDLMEEVGLGKNRVLSISKSQGKRISQGNVVCHINSWHGINSPSPGTVCVPSGFLG